MRHIINTGTSKDPTAMGLMYFILAKFKLLISASHLAGKANTYADTLLCNNASHFLPTFSQALHTPIPAVLTNLLVDTKPDLTSLTWSRMFDTIFKQPSPKAQCTPTPLVTTGIPTSAPALAVNPFLLPKPFSAISLSLTCPALPHHQ